MQEKPLPPALAHLASGRDYVQTHEFAHSLGCASQTIRKNHCHTGACFGIVPIKVGNRLLWPVVDIARLLSEGTKK